MADFLPPVVASILCDIHEYSAKLGEASAEMAAFTDTSKSSFEKLAGFGQKAAEGIAIAGVAIGATSVKLAADFQRSTLLMQTQAGASATEMRNMSSAILDMAASVGQTPKALSDAAYWLESVGLRGSAALDALRAAAEGAAVGNTDVASTASALGSVLMSKVPGIASATDAMAQLIAIVGQGKMTMADLNSSLSSGILGTAAVYGVSLRSIGAAMDILTGPGGNTAETAATRLRMTIALMGGPSKQAAGILTDLGLSAADAGARMNAMEEMLTASGVTVTKLAGDMRQPDGIMVALRDLKTHMDAAGLSADYQAATITRAFGGGRMGAGILSLFQNMDDLKGRFDAIGKSASDFHLSFEKTTGTLDFQFHQMVAYLEVLGIQIGNWLIPKLEALFSWVDKNKETVLVIAAAIAGPVIVAIGAWIASLFAVGGALAALDLPLLALVAASAAAAAFVAGHWKGVASIIGDVGRGVGAVVSWISGQFSGGGRPAAPPAPSSSLLPRSPVATPVRMGAAPAGGGDSRVTLGDAPAPVAPAGDTLTAPVPDKSAWQSLLSYTKDRLHELATFWAEHGQSIEAIGRDMWAIITTVTQTSWQTLVGIFHVFAPIVSGIWDTLWVLMSFVVKEAISLIGGVVKLGMDLILAAVGLVADVLTGKWGQAWKDIKGVVKDSVDFIVGLANDLSRNLTKAFGDVLHSLSLFKDAWSGVKDIWNTVAGFFGGGGSGKQWSGSSGVIPAHSAVGRYVSSPMLSWLGEQGPELVLPLDDSARAAQLLGTYAPSLVGATSNPAAGAYVAGAGNAAGPRAFAQSAGGSTVNVNMQVNVEGSLLTERQLVKDLSPKIRTELMRYGRALSTIGLA